MRGLHTPANRALVVIPAFVLAFALSPRGAAQMSAEAALTIPSPLPAAGIVHGGLAVQHTFDRLVYEAVKERVDVLITGFAAAPEHSFDLELHAFRVTHERTQFVLNGPNGTTNAEAPDVTLLRGRVAGAPASRVFLGLSPHGSIGYIVHDDGVFIITSYAPNGPQPQARVTISYRRDSPALPSDPSLSDPPSIQRSAAGLASFQTSTLDTPFPGGGGIADGPECLEAVIALDTDHEYFRLFNDPAAAAAYLVELTGAISDIFERDSGVRLTLGFVQIWTTPNDPYTSSDPFTLLNQLTNYWFINMGHVDRAAVQLVSARNLIGAVFSIGWPDGLCSARRGYALSSSIQGFFSDPLLSRRPDNWDIYAVAHTWGSTFGAGPPPQGSPTLMSGAPVSQIVLEFHQRNHGVIRASALAAPCIRDTIPCAHLGRGDLNCDAAFNAADIDPFFLALGDPTAYRARFPSCDAALLGDMNADGFFDGGDIDPFFEALGGP